MLVWAVWCYPDTCLELLKVIWSWAVFPDVQAVFGPSCILFLMLNSVHKERVD